jgi:hypothetical protein
MWRDGDRGAAHAERASREAALVDSALLPSD